MLTLLSFLVNVDEWLQSASAENGDDAEDENENDDQGHPFLISFESIVYRRLN